MEPWIKLPRSWIDDGSILDPKGARVLLYLLKLLNNAPKKVHGHLLEPGQVFVGSVRAARSAGVSRSCFWRYVKRYANEGKLKRNVKRNGTIISIVALMTYEDGRKVNETGTETRSEALAETVGGNNQERKKDSYLLNERKVLREGENKSSFEGNGAEYPWPKGF